MKKLYIKYDPEFREEFSTEALHIYIPAEKGYIDHTLGHTVWEKANADMWRLSIAYACGDNFEEPFPVTIGGEWDMALRLEGRPDFIGGYAHGDEHINEIKFIVNGEARDLRDFSNVTEIDSLSIIADSTGFDPCDGVTPAIKHHKAYTVTTDGIRLEQRVSWLIDATLNYCYLAMMPPAKKYTDSFYTDLTEDTELDLSKNPTVNGATSATVYGKESGLYYTMSTNKYHVFGEGRLRIRDNAGGSYNKMYFDFTSGGEVKKGDVWETLTVYKIDRK